MKTVLSNGLTVIIEQSASAPVVAIQVWVGVGSADELPEEQGLAHFHEHMLFKGTPTRGPGALAHEIEASGGEINAWTSLDRTVYHVVLASRYFDRGLDVLADAVQHATFPEDEIEREIEVVVEEVLRADDHPFRLLNRHGFATVFAGHPYGRPITGSVEDVRRISRAQLVRFFEQWYVPQNMVVVIAGDVDPAHALTRLETLFATSRSAQLLPVRPVVIRAPQTALRSVVVGGPFMESQLQLLVPVPDLLHPDVPDLDLLAVILGQGDSSRLNQLLKRRLGIVNDAYCYAFTPRQAGFFCAGATLPPEQIEAALHALSRELHRATTSLPSSAELAKAKTIVHSERVYAQETVQGQARRLGFYGSLAGEPEWEEQYYAAIDRATPESIRNCARRYLLTENITAALLVPESQLAEWHHERLQGLVSIPAQPRSVTRARPGELERRVLDNGVVFVSQNDPTVALVSLRAAYLGGLRFEDTTQGGLNNLLAQMLTKGTQHRTAAQIASELDLIAGSLDGISGRNSFGFRGDFLSSSITEGLELFFECLRVPAFGEAEFGREKQLALEEIKSREDNFSGVAFRQFAAALYGDHPYGRDVVGNAESVGSITAADLMATYRRCYHPADMVFGVVGDVDSDWVCEHLQALLPVAAGPRTEFRPLPAIEPLSGPQHVFTERTIGQCHLVLGYLGLTLQEDARYALEVLTTILSGQGGRLFLELRDKQSLAYSVTAFNVEGLEPGYAAFYGATSPDKVEQLRDGMLHEIARCCNAEPAASELDRAREYLLGTHDIGLQKRAALCSTMVYDELFGLGHDDHTNYAKRVQAVTAKDVRTVAERIFQPERHVISVVGPRVPW